MLAGRAYLVDGGTGLCNAIYVDNVVHGILRAGWAPQADGEAFLLGEHEVPSWQEFYGKVAAYLGLGLDRIASVPFEDRAPTFMERLDALRLSGPVQKILGTIPPGLRRGLGAFWEESGALPVTPATGPHPTLELALLHRSRHVPSWDKARTVLGYEPPVAAAEAWQRTLAWLSIAGYPTAEQSRG